MCAVRLGAAGRRTRAQHEGEENDSGCRDPADRRRTDGERVGCDGRVVVRELLRFVANPRVAGWIPWPAHDSEEFVITGVWRGAVHLLYGRAMPVLG